MAKKKSQSLTQRIEELINRTGEKPAPNMGDIKSELVDWLGVAQELEDGAVVRDLETKVEILEASLEKLNLENGNLNGELKAFRAERKKQEQEKKREDIPTIQFEILKRLPTQSEGHWAKIRDVSHAGSIPIDETEIHLYRLMKAGLVIGRTTYGQSLWRRTTRGSEHVVAMRLAGEGDGEKAHKDADLPQVQEEALRIIAQEEDGITEREISEKLREKLPLVRHHLHSLREAEMATDAGEPGNEFVVVETYEADDKPYSPTWKILRKGEAYLAERDLL